MAGFAIATIAFTTLNVGCIGPQTVGTTKEGAAIVEIPLRLSNVYLVKSQHPVLIDSGTLGDMRDLSQALGDSGVPIRDLALVILTHGHADHAGLASDLRDASDAKILLGAGDLPLASAGHNDDLHAMSFAGSVLKPFITSIYPPFDPDIVVRDSEIDLTPVGIDGKVIAMPGHTKGSLVVVLANHAAFVGDMIAGGSLGGLFFPHDPHEHYFQADEKANRANIKKLLTMGVDTFYLGHGGPVNRADVASAFQL